MVRTLILTVIMGIITGFIPLIMRHILDELVRLSKGGATSANIHAVFLVLLFLFAVRCVQQILYYVSTRTSNRLRYHLQEDLRTGVFQRLAGLSIDYFEKNRIGEVVARSSAAISEMQSWMTGFTGNYALQFVTLVVSVSLLAFVSPLAGLIMTLAVALRLLLHLSSLKRNVPDWEHARKLEEHAAGNFSETLSNMSTIRSLAHEGLSLKQFRHIMDQYTELEIKTDDRMEQSFLVREAVVLIGSTLSFGIIAYAILNGQETVGTLLAASLYIQQITSASRPIGRLIIDTGRANVAVGRIVEIYSEVPAVIDVPNAKELENIKTIEFRNVSFSYPKLKTAVLKDISFRIEDGQTFAIVGKSGCGKTTITKLLMRFYEPTSGQILINDKPVSHYTQESIRNKIGIVLQDVALFNGTIDFNLRLAKANATPAEIRAAAQAAHADDFIDDMAEGYKTIVGERGIKVSGGEKQRIAIARAILKDPDLIILDEATSALDSESEHAVQAGLKSLLAKRTALVIAHRLSTIIHSDQILVIKNGTIIEQGTHTELLADKTIYANFYKTQVG